MPQSQGLAKRYVLVLSGSRLLFPRLNYTHNLFQCGKAMLVGALIPTVRCVVGAATGFLNPHPCVAHWALHRNTPNFCRSALLCSRHISFTTSTVPSTVGCLRGLRNVTSAVFTNPASSSGGNWLSLIQVPQSQLQHCC